MDHRKAAQTPVTSVRVRETLRQIAPSRVALPLVADPQMIINALPLGVVIAQPAADGRWIVAASNNLFDRWSSLEEGRDRKRVGAGKRVSGRVDLGGRRDIKKKIRN